MSFLESKALILRPIEPDDLSFLLEVENDSREWMHSENYMPFSKAVMSSYVNGEHDLVKHGQYRFMIHDSDKNVPIGCIDLFNYSAIHSRAGIGIYIAQEHRNSGKASAALDVLCNYSKEVLNLELVYCSVLKSNLHSLKLFSRAGFETTGVRPKWSKLGGVREDVILLQRVF